MIFAAIDWAEQNHMLVVVDAEGRTLAKARFDHSQAGLEDLEGTLRAQATFPAEVAVAIELNEGLLLDWLLHQGYQVFGINPKSAERARDRYTSAALKDDERDAWALAEFLRTSHQHLRCMRPDSEPTMALTAWVRLREDLVQERTIHLQRLRSHLVQWNPHFLQAIRDLNASWTLDLLEQTPTADEFAHLKWSKIKKFAKGRRLRSITQDRILSHATFSSPTIHAARNQAHALEVRHRVQAIRSLNRRIDEIDLLLAQLIESHPDVNIFRSLPVKGAVTIASFLAGFGEDRERWSGHEEVAARWGAAPITQQSGKHKTVKRRMACDSTIHQAWLWFSFNTITRPYCWARAYYQEKRKNGADHYTALRCLAQRWIRIVYRLWQDRLLYDEQLYQERRNARLKPKSEI